VSQVQTWTQHRESGSFASLQFARAVFRTLGLPVLALLLYPAAAYFFVRRREARRASLAYLKALWNVPAGRAVLGREPGWGNVFRHLHEFGTHLVDRMVLWGSGFDKLHFEHEGSEHLFELARRRQGAIMLGAHVGSFDMMRVLAGSGGLTVNVLMFTDHAERINTFFEQLDPGSRVRVIHVDPGSIRTAFEIKACIERGELVGVMADRIDPGGRERTLETSFLGRPARFPLSPYLLAGALGCPVLSSLCVRTGAQRYRVEVRPLLPARDVADSDREDQARALLEAYVHGLEDACARAPYQWFNFYDFWAAAGRADHE
jgi:predicted LPLAT superfamily acyltransferase